MGISGLLPLLSNIQKPTHIENFKGQTVAIDGHCILHRGSYADAISLALNKESNAYLNYFMHYIDLLEYHKVTPIVVFDGLPLPIKKVTNDERNERRSKAYNEGLACYGRGDKDEAAKYFRQSIKITPDMIRAVIMQLKKKRVEVIVAPYEADAQLAYLVKKNKATAVITEDSDLLAFGCSKIIYKMDRMGYGTEINYSDIFNNSALIGVNTPEKLRHMCIISGCDYLPSVKGVGIKTSLKYFEELKNTERVLHRIQFKHAKTMPKDYKKSFYEANSAFLYQWVYDLDLKQYIRFSTLSTDDQLDLSFLGKFPSIKESTLLRVNKIIIPRGQPLNPEDPKSSTIVSEDISDTFSLVSAISEASSSSISLGTPSLTNTSFSTTSSTLSRTSSINTSASISIPSLPTLDFKTLVARSVIYNPFKHKSTTFTATSTTTTTVTECVEMHYSNRVQNQSSSKRDKLTSIDNTIHTKSTKASIRSATLLNHFLEHRQRKLATYTRIGYNSPVPYSKVKKQRIKTDHHHDNEHSYAIIHDENTDPNVCDPLFDQRSTCAGIKNNTQTF